jgi:hypothetical protein
MMAKQQKRRTVSMKPNTYGRLGVLADLRGLSRSGLVEELINKAADSAGVPERVEPPKRRPSAAPKTAPNGPEWQGFTF